MKKRSVTISGHATSVTVEEPFWTELQSIAKAEGLPVNNLIAQIDEMALSSNLSSAIRIYVLNAVKSK